MFVQRPLGIQRATGNDDRLTPATATFWTRSRRCINQHSVPMSPVLIPIRLIAQAEHRRLSLAHRKNQALRLRRTRCSVNTLTSRRYRCQLVNATPAARTTVPPVLLRSACMAFNSAMRVCARFKSRSAQSLPSSFHTRSWAGCVLGVWWCPLYELHVHSSTGSEAEAVCECGVVTE
jgi:hypothetical protein